MVLKSHPQYIRPVTVPVAVEIGIAGLTKDGDTKSCTWLRLWSLLKTISTGSQRRVTKVARITGLCGVQGEICKLVD